MNHTLDPKSLFKGLEDNRSLIVAVSGGSDSIALLLLASAWAQHVGVDLQVVTVDHGLRPEAAAEAAFVAGVSEGLNIPHVTLAWDGVKPMSGVAHAARNARYRLLEEFANDIDVNTVLVGHTANDQAETIMMRNARGSHDSFQGRGLSGMSHTVLLPGGTKLVRPLLGLTRKMLRDYLVEVNQSWVEDPSNHDTAYERVNVRQSLGDDEDHILQISRFAEINGRERRLIASKVAKTLQSDLNVDQGPVYSFPQATLSQEGPQARTLALQVVIAIAGGSVHFVPSSKIAGFINDHAEKRITLGNTVLERHQNTFRIYRETRNLDSILIAPGDDVVWDNRLRVVNESATTYFCGPLDPSRISDAEIILGHPLAVKPRVALGSSPFLCGDGDDLFLPMVKGFPEPANVTCSMVCPAIEHFCPEYDFTLLELLEGIREKFKKPKTLRP